MSKDLNPQKALIFRITHRDNVPWILDHGLHCRNSSEFDPNFVPIGNAEIIDKRRHKVVPCAPGGTLSDYVPFYFTPFSPMLLNIVTGRGVRQVSKSEIVLLVSSVRRLSAMGLPFVFTDYHALMRAANFYTDLAGLERIDWGILQRRDFKRDDDLEKIDRYMAEALIHKHAPLEALAGIACYDDGTIEKLTAELAKRTLSVKISKQPDWYF